MPSSRPLDQLNDIVVNCDSILGYTTRLDLDAYMAGPQIVRDAVFSESARPLISSEIISTAFTRMRIGKVREAALMEIARLSAQSRS